LSNEPRQRYNPRVLLNAEGMHKEIGTSLRHNF
jgi:hypothetical protein